jgi:hypothetical protein
MSVRCCSLYTWHSNGQNTIYDGEFSTVIDLALHNGTDLSAAVTAQTETSFPYSYANPLSEGRFFQINIPTEALSVPYLLRVEG